MNSLKLFILQFFKRGGAYVLFSSFGTKVISLIVSVYIARLLTTQDYAVITYALMITTFLIPFSGLGMDFVLLRYGALTEAKSELFKYTLKFGTLSCVFFVFVIVIFSDNLSINDARSSLVIKLLSPILIIEFLYRIIQNNLRINEKNKLYAMTGAIRSISLLLFSFVFVNYFLMDGYIAALLLSPIVTILFFFRTFSNVRYVREESLGNNKNEMVKYGLLIGFGSMISQLQIPLAGILLGKFSDSITDIAFYKVASVIPMSLLFIPNIFFKSEFVYLTKNNNSKLVIRNYIKNYWYVSLLISIFLLLIAAFLPEFTMVTVFGDKYSGAGDIFSVLILAVVGGFMFRQLFGNLIFASGRADINTMISILALFISILVLPYMIQYRGAIGAAYGTVIVFWVTGFISMICYYRYVYKNIN